jgi:hypothetical protein
MIEDEMLRQRFWKRDTETHIGKVGQTAAFGWQC